ncbi:zf-HC2 domain-containing protein [Methylotenera sp.]|uniref:zf-HC2 domain-containing protein n=1 Tax=Methylotenera sp. TaxID=2051956 RepID=UPI0025D09FBE|nr:zf-HC2 domain-containing protein [Methylotenera sp.]
MKFMLNCKQASQLISQSLENPLSSSKRIKLKFHLLLCAACTRFRQQLRLINNATKRIRLETENDDTLQLPLESKTRIFQQISSHIESKNH